MSQDSINLKLVGFSEYEAQIIESVLSLAERGLLKKWRLVTDLPADYYLLPGNLIERMNQDEVLKTLPRDRCIFSSREKNNANGESQERWLLCDSRNVPRIRSMIDLFNLLCEDTPVGRKNQEPVIRAADVPPSEVIPAAETASPSAAVPGEAFNPHDGFIGELLDAANKTGFFAYELKLPNSPGRIYVHPEKKVFYSPVNQELLAPFFTANKNLISCDIRDQVTKSELKRLSESEGLKPYPLRSLLWYGVFKSSQGRLQEGSSTDKPVRLQRWPDLNLSDSQELIKLAAFMQSNAADLPTISEKTGVPIPLVKDFYNACEIVGLIEQSPEADIHNKRLNPEKVSLFSKIRSRLNKASPT